MQLNIAINATMQNYEKNSNFNKYISTTVDNRNIFHKINIS